MNRESVLACENVSRYFTLANSQVDVLKEISFDVKKGDAVSIVGASGSGKTTLLNLLAGLDNPSQGKVKMVGQEINGMKDKQRALIRNRHMGFVFQFHHLLPEFSAIDNVLMPCRISGKITPQMMNYAQELLSQVGLLERMTHRPSELSGGERQRVAIARALVKKPEIVLMDEPTGNLDEETSEQVQNLIGGLNKLSHSSFIVVTHNTQWANKMPTQFVLTKGKLLKSS